MLRVLLVEDNGRLREALREGLERAGVRVVEACEAGEEAVEICLADPPEAILMDVQLAGAMNGIEAACAIRRERPRLPVVFYSIEDDDEYYRAFHRSGILSHYAYVRKSNYLLPELVVPLLTDAAAGRSFIDPDVEARVQEVRARDAHCPFDLLEPHEREVAEMIADGMTNEQIAQRMGFRDKRTISRVNGQIYAAWGLSTSTTDEKIARTRAALIVRAGLLLRWDDAGRALALDERGKWSPWSPR